MKKKIHIIVGPNEGKCEEFGSMKQKNQLKKYLIDDATIDKTNKKK